jgi:16S rRNA (uracil1498-N3)-methyltransferase
MSAAWHCRLFVDAPLGPGLAVALAAPQAHYLLTVLRLAAGEPVALFNGRDGEWLAHIATTAKRSCGLVVERPLREQAASPDLWLVFAPVKRARIDFIAAKATELGVACLQPVITRRTEVARVNAERLRANAIEAAEQCERLDVPEVREPVALGALLASWPAGRRLVYCAERAGAPPMIEALAGAGARGGPWAVLIGPEGGFAPEEAAQLGRLPQAVAVSLGPRILRADTAAVAALTLWQAALGDWSMGVLTKP